MEGSLPRWERSRVTLSALCLTCGFGGKLVYWWTWGQIPRHAPFLRPHHVPLATATQAPRLQDSSQVYCAQHRRVGLGWVEVVGRVDFWMTAWQCSCASRRNSANTWTEETWVRNKQGVRREGWQSCVWRLRMETTEDMWDVRDPRPLWDTS
jgi:hypothetical protein